ncbi:FAD-dependent oxidoreductase [Patescibacteria group bacterium]|jgi:ferredoxin-NADP reductase|nr:FAD-dependent oxidoreductase [Patescibacteria group bacterium]
MPLPELRPFRVTANRPLAEEAYELVLEPADEKPMFSFIAGQWVMMHLLSPDGTSWGRAAFSIATAPTESKQSLELAIKIYGDFTKRAHGLKEGDLVNLQGPYGVFTLRPGTDPLILFSGGIGVTPLRSMLREMALTNDPRQVVHFYSNKSPAATSYLAELRDLEREHPNLKTVFVYTRESSSEPHEEGRLTREMMARYVTDFSSAQYFMCGPNPFMDAIKMILEAEGVDCKARLHKERFS